MRHLNHVMHTKFRHGLLHLQPTTRIRFLCEIFIEKLTFVYAHILPTKPTNPLHISKLVIKVASFTFISVFLPCQLHSVIISNMMLSLQWFLELPKDDNKIVQPSIGY